MVHLHLAEFQHSLPATGRCGRGASMMQSQIHAGILDGSIVLQITPAASWVSLTRLQARALAARLTRLAGDQQMEEWECEPRPAERARAERDAAILALSREGMNLDQIASGFGLSKSRVCNIVNREEMAHATHHRLDSATASAGLDSRND